MKAQVGNIHHNPKPPNVHKTPKYTNGQDFPISRHKPPDHPGKWIYGDLPGEGLGWVARADIERERERKKKKKTKKQKKCE